MMVSFASRLSVSPNILISKVGDESVILNLDSERYFGLDETGTNMWTVLTTSDSVESAYRALLAEYEVDAETLRRDLNELIEKLIEHGMLEISGE